MSKKRVDTDRCKMDKEASDNMVKCVCSHTMPIPAWKDKEICTYCGRVMRNTTKNHFKYKLRQMLK